MSRVIPFRDTTHGNVVEELRYPENPISPIGVLQALYGLWVSGVVSQDAFFLGAQVCQMMHAAEVTQVVHTGVAAQNTVVMMGSTLYSGKVSKDLGKYVGALQDLHFRAGLLNDLAEPALFKEENRKRHFTLSPSMTAGRHYSSRTPIYFRVALIEKGEFYTLANKLADESLGQVTKTYIIES